MPATPQVTSGSARPALAFLLIFLVAAELLALFSGWRVASWTAIGCVLALPFFAYTALHLREAYLIAAAFILAALAWWLGKPLASLFTEGLERSAFLAAFILLMALLREGANTSRSIVRVGNFLTHQPPGRRFYTVFGGSHFFSVLINLGSLSLLAPIIQRGVRADYREGSQLDDIGLAREQRQLSAALRGFSWFLVWAPTAVTQAVMPTLMSGINAFKLIGIGLIMALIMMFVSRLADFLRWRSFAAKLRVQHRSPAVIRDPFPRRAFRNVGLVAGALFGLSIALSQIFSTSLISGVMLSAPVVVTLWLLIQAREQHEPILTTTAARLDSIAFAAMPAYIREVLFVACAGFIGTVAAKLVPVPELAAAIQLDTLPAAVILGGLSIAVLLFGQIGFSPITSAVFLGSLVAQVPNMPVDITLVALAIAAGTAICSTGAPFSAGILMLSRATDISPYTLSWRWNGPYTLMAVAVLLPLYEILALIFG